MKSLRPMLLAVVTLAYPLLVYLGLGRFEPRFLALLLVGLALLRAFTQKERVWVGAAAGAGVLALAGVVSNAAFPLKLYPLVVNGTLLWVFALSLVYPPTLIERLARLREPELPPQAVAYTRRVTQVWCGFFVLNGGVSLATVAWASDAGWALYNGFISYVLMGLLFAAEWWVRRRVRQRAKHG